MADQHGDGTVSDTTAEAADKFEGQMKSYNLAKKCRSIVLDDTPLNRAIGQIMDVLLEVEPVLGQDNFDESSIMVHLLRLPTVTDILTVEVFNTPAAPIMLLRHALQAHNADIISEGNLQDQGLTLEELADGQMSLVIWLAMMRGAGTNEIADGLARFRAFRDRNFRSNVIRQPDPPVRPASPPRPLPQRRTVDF